MPSPVTETTLALEAGVVYTKPWTVEVMLDLAGYTADRRLGEMVALEPSAGDGAFLRGMARRVVESCRRHRLALSKADEAIRAYEIDPASAQRARETIRAELSALEVPAALANRLAKSWVRTADFLEEALGFPVADFVIGNPPYIRLEEIPAGKASLYRNAFVTMKGRADIYVAFYEAALMQLKPGGVCAYICADRWLLNDYGGALREYVTTKGFSVRYVIETHDVDAFESEVDAYPAITVIAHEPQGSVVVAKALPGIEHAEKEHVVDLLSHAKSNAVIRSARFKEWFRGTEPWPCSSPDRLRCLKQLEATCPHLESTETGTKVGIGVATGADPVFIVNQRVDVESNRLLPLAMADDLQGARVTWSGHYLLNPWNEKGLVHLPDYPRLRAHLGKHKSGLQQRHTAQKDRPDRWHKTIDRVNSQLLAQPKLYIADIRSRLRPAYDEGKTYPHHNLYWITSEEWSLPVLGALLMSQVGEFFIHCYGVKMRGGYFRFQAQYLRRIRVPELNRIDARLAKALRAAFFAQDAELATKLALEAYQLDGIPD
jgi:hypothetical protein